MPDHSPRLTVAMVTEMSDELYQACQRLIPQLSSTKTPPTTEQLSMLLASPASFLYQAKHQDFGDEIIGLATLVVYRVPTGVRGYIEDVVVDERARGRRIGEALTWACLEQAKLMGAPQVMLTSNPGRQAAIRLYQRMGFELRNTNVFRYKFTK